MRSPDPPDGTTRYRVRHVTHYRYQASVELAHHLLHLEPRPMPERQDFAWSLAVEPSPAATARHLDCFGNPVTYVAIEAPHDALRISSELEITVRRPPAVDLAATPPWEQVRDAIAAAPDEAAPDEAARGAAAFAYASARIPPLAALSAYAGVSFPPAAAIGTAASDLASRIHRDFVFDPVATNVSTPLATVLVNRRGVCQDLAHVAIGCLRAVGLSARYVSGYLRTIPPAGSPRPRGADASHAWVSVWCGQDGWIDFDPTNGQTNPLDYVTIAWGRDFDDVSPARGILFGGGGHSVAVEVDVEPVDEAAHC
ncbi:MAG TPA: transglutaminase family protein [Stellaceae bacterium]|nr:transglutaminase family protein [Stellaceae bacterium]